MGQYGQLGKVVQLFNGKKNGFFIECGALDGGFNITTLTNSREIDINLNSVFLSGEKLSNTLVFELRHQWTGLLVEANPFAYRELREKQRK